MNSKRKKETAVVFCVTADLSFAVASVMMDILKYSPGMVSEFVVIHDGIGKKDQRLLNSIFPTRFLKYSFPIKKTYHFNQGTLNYFSKMVYAKYECFRLLDEYKNVLYTDCDVVIRGDISQLLEPSESGFKIIISREMLVKNQLHEEVADYQMNLPGSSTAIFVLQDNLGNYSELYDWCYFATEKYAKYLAYPEQAIFDFLLQEFKLSVEKIDQDLYCMHPVYTPNNENAIILHAWGKNKFWSGIPNAQWEENYRRWKLLGGSPFKKKADWKFTYKLVNAIKKISEKVRTR